MKIVRGSILLVNVIREEVRNLLEDYINPSRIVSVKKWGKHGAYNVKEYDIECSFDIETTTMWSNKEDGKRTDDRAYMYHWQWGIGHFPEDYIIITGRTWEEFYELIQIIGEIKDEKVNLYCYVQNLSFEFQFIKDRMNWRVDKNGNADIFASKPREVIKAVTEDNITFMDSQILSGGKSLAKIGEELTKYKVKKMAGDLDYEKKRNSMTPLTKEEYMYCLNDVKVVMAYIREEKERYGSTTNIPMTNTGRVREDVKKLMHFDDDYNKEKVKTAINYYEYHLLAEAYSGGYVHANPLHAGKELRNVASIDFASSYPTVMLSEYYPAGEIFHIDYPTIKELFGYLWVGRYIFKNIRLKDSRPDGIIAKSHCKNLEEPYIINGKVFKADYLETSGTSVDFFDILDFYDYDDVKVYDVMGWTEKKPLPYNFRRAVAKYFRKKSMLKGLEGQEAEYMLSKNMLNALYGMTVTSLLHESNIYDTEERVWITRINDEEMKVKLIDENQEGDRFCDYCWGVFITSYARHNLYDGIVNIGRDYVYSDTDSIKLLNYEKHKAYIETYNKNIEKKLRKVNGDWFYEHLIVCANKDGELKEIGIWDYEGTYDRFKALRAKAYLSEKDGKMISTIAGVNKKAGSKMFQNIYDRGENPFDELTYFMRVSEKDCGKLASIYQDAPHRDVVVDEYGNEELMEEYSSVALKPVGYCMNADDNMVLIKLMNEFIKERNR